MNKTNTKKKYQPTNQPATTTTQTHPKQPTNDCWLLCLKFIDAHIRGLDKMMSLTGWAKDYVFFNDKTKWILLFFVLMYGFDYEKNWKSNNVVMDLFKQMVF